MKTARFNLKIPRKLRPAPLPPRRRRPRLGDAPARRNNRAPVLAFELILAALVLASLALPEPAQKVAGAQRENAAAPLAAPVQRTARLSHYWPPLGGPNCATFAGGECVSKMASGLPWEQWVGRAAACPEELPFWTEIVLPGGEVFYCLDRGGKIVTTPAGELWIDLLVERAPVPYGTVMPVTVRYPGGFDD